MARESMTKADFLKEGFGRHYPWLDLVNSQQWDSKGQLTDYLFNPRWLIIFLRHWQLSTASGTTVLRQNFVKLRATLRRIAEGVATGKKLSAEDISAINKALDAPLSHRLERAGGKFQVKLVPLVTGWPRVQAQIARSFAETLARNCLDRVKMCANVGCRWVFHDSTKGNMRLWCNDRTCGNRIRVRRARAAAKSKRVSRGT
jgi:predicted RNA-binding Zn ribbon-like protein